MKRPKKGIAVFEWILLITFLAIGIVGGFAVVRDSLVIESAETADAILHHNKSYDIAHPLMTEIKISTAGPGTPVDSFTGTHGEGSRYEDPIIPGDTSAVIVKTYDKE